MRYWITYWTVHSAGYEFDQSAVFEAENKWKANAIVKERYYGSYGEYDTDWEGHGYSSDGCREITKTDYDVLKRFI